MGVASMIVLVTGALSLVCGILKIVKHAKTLDKAQQPEPEPGKGRLHPA